MPAFSLCSPTSLTLLPLKKCKCAWRRTQKGHLFNRRRSVGKTHSFAHKFNLSDGTQINSHSYVHKLRLNIENYRENSVFSEEGLTRISGQIRSSKSGCKQNPISYYLLRTQHINNISGQLKIGASENKTKRTHKIRGTKNSRTNFEG